MMTMSPINAAPRVQRASSLFSIPSNSRGFTSGNSSFVWVQKRIKVQLRTDHPTHGSKGKVIRVKPGYMRQQLYPAGKALYCAGDGIPMHHFQPPPSPETKVPPPGLSRPLTDLLNRLGLHAEFTEAELQTAQAQIDRWKHSANNPTSSPQVLPSDTLPQIPPPLLALLKGLDEHLRETSRSLYSTKRPFLVFKRAGPENSDTLYSSIKADELISKVIETFNIQSYPLDSQSSSSSLPDHLKVLGRSDAIKDLKSSSPQENDPDPKILVDDFSEFKPIKSVGTYAVYVSLSSSPLQIGESIPNGCYKLLIQVEK